MRDVSAKVNIGVSVGAWELELFDISQNECVNSNTRIKQKVESSVASGFEKERQ